jgi:hypothetical protein
MDRVFSRSDVYLLPVGSLVMVLAAFLPFTTYWAAALGFFTGNRIKIDGWWRTALRIGVNLFLVVSWIVITEATVDMTALLLESDTLRFAGSTVSVEFFPFPAGDSLGAATVGTAILPAARALRSEAASRTASRLEQVARRSLDS